MQKAGVRHLYWDQKMVVRCFLMAFPSYSWTELVLGVAREISWECWQDLAPEQMPGVQWQALEDGPDHRGSRSSLAKRLNATEMSQVVCKMLQKQHEALRGVLASVVWRLLGNFLALWQAEGFCWIFTEEHTDVYCIPIKPDKHYAVIRFNLVYGAAGREATLIWWMSQFTHQDVTSKKHNPRLLTLIPPLLKWLGAIHFSLQDRQAHGFPTSRT